MSQWHCSQSEQQISICCAEIKKDQKITNAFNLGSTREWNDLRSLNLWLRRRPTVHSALSDSLYRSSLEFICVTQTENVPPRGREANTTASLMSPFTILNHFYNSKLQVQGNDGGKVHHIYGKQKEKRVCDAAFPPPGVSSCTAGRDKCLAWGCLSRANTYQHRSLNPYPLAERRCPFHYGFLQPLNTLHEGWLLWLQALLIILLLP